MITRKQHHNKKQLLNQSGQTLIEFILLLVVVTAISFSFMALVNRQIASRWQSMAQIILEDDTQQLQLR